MSLTSFLENKDVKERFRTEFSKPRFGVKRELLAPPRSKRYGLVGTAFDYLLRFYLQRLNPDAIRWAWVAEDGLRDLSLEATPTTASYDIDTGEITIGRPSVDPKLLGTARRMFNDAWIAHERYITRGRMDNDLFKSVLRLAQLDTFFRSGYIDRGLGKTY